MRGNLRMAAAKPSRAPAGAGGSRAPVVASTPSPGTGGGPTGPGERDFGDDRHRLSVRVRGTVQGVGFRPFVYRVAIRHELGGWVRNSTGPVEIEVEGGAPD